MSLFLPDYSLLCCQQKPKQDVIDFTNFQQ